MRTSRHSLQFSFLPKFPFSPDGDGEGKGKCSLNKSEEIKITSEHHHFPFSHHMRDIRMRKME